jgi:hypothetical protein
MAARRVLVEVKIHRDTSPETAIAIAREWARFGFSVDPTYIPVPASGDSVTIRGTLQDEARWEELKRQPEVLGVWDDAAIGPMS